MLKKDIKIINKDFSNEFITDYSEFNNTIIDNFKKYLGIGSSGNEQYSYIYKKCSLGERLWLFEDNLDKGYEIQAKEGKVIVQYFELNDITNVTCFKFNRVNSSKNELIAPNVLFYYISEEIRMISDIQNKENINSLNVQNKENTNSLNDEKNAENFILFLMNNLDKSKVQQSSAESLLSSILLNNNIDNSKNPKEIKMKI